MVNGQQGEKGVNHSDISNSYNTHNQVASNGTTAHSKNSMFFLNKKKSVTTEKVKSTKDLSLLKLNEKTSGKMEIPKKNTSSIVPKRTIKHVKGSLGKKNSLPDSSTLKFDPMSRADMVKLLMDQDL
jgi:hypothetical protein